MRGLMREMAGWAIGGIAGLQAAADCVLLRVPDNITPVIMIVVILAVGSAAVRRMQKSTAARKPRRRKVQMYDLKEIETPDWPMIEI